MFPFFNIFGREIPLYGIMFVLGAFVSIGFALLRRKKYDMKFDDTLYAALFAVVGAIVGAKILYIFTMIVPIVKNWDVLMENNVSFWDIIMFAAGGFVFFGGLIGGTVGGIIYLKIFKINVPAYVDLAAPSIPLAHAFGRVGCFFGGCCYGIEASWGLEFNNSPAVPPELHGVRLLPVQLFEAGVNILLVFIILIYERFRKNNKNNSGKNILLYLILYSVSRFTLEFFRGDVARGLFFGVSTSQIISIILFFISTCLFLFYGKSTERKNKSEVENM